MTLVNEFEDMPRNALQQSVIAKHPLCALQDCVCVQMESCRTAIFESSEPFGLQILRASRPCVPTPET